MFKLVRNLLLASPAMIGLVLGSQLSAVAQSNANSNTELPNLWGTHLAIG
ncbi:MAG: hypothetical protein AAFY16_08735 [Cyanobacteria bacterium J06642_3]